MRGRRDSGVRLDHYHRIAQTIIMSYQDPVTGLFPASPTVNHAWVRDNVYTILAVWGLSMSYKKMADMDEDRAKTYELEQSCVKLMRGLLMCMMRQRHKVEKFKSSRNPTDSLHAKYSAKTGCTVVGDSEWGHLQVDAVSLYLLILAQMTASGLQIIFSLDEVAFIQNLVFYIESAYCIPDYGIWERGDKANHGLLELNASSIGMAKAALEAMNELDLFGARGGPTSVIHVLADEAQKCQAVLQSMLPRESSSKEIDSGLLSVIGFPAFAVDDPKLIETTRQTIVSKLKGNYGCKRFLRDGYRTPREDPNRLHYEPSELRMFENIECEWPLFFCYLWMDAFYHNDPKAASYYAKELEKVLVADRDGIMLVPEMYTVDNESAEAESQNPGSQVRHPAGRSPFLWAQSLYILGKLFEDEYLAPAELDPLNRRLCSVKKPDVVVQVVILAENQDIQNILKIHDIDVQTMEEVAPIQVLPARVLGHLYTYLGRNRKLNMTGRTSRDVGILSTSKLYSLQDKLFAFTPQLMDQNRYYIASDHDLMIDLYKSELNFLKSSWKNMLGRPLVVMTVRPIHLDDGKMPAAMISTMKKLKSGYINGTRVSLGKLNDFLTTSCITNLSFLGCQEDGAPELLMREVADYLGEVTGRWQAPRMGIAAIPDGPSNERSNKQRRISVRGAIKRTRSIISHSLHGDTGSGGISEVASEGGSSPEHPSPFAEPEPIKHARLHQPPVIQSTHQPRLRLGSDAAQYAKSEVQELLTMLKESKHLEEQGDILQYLIDTHGIHMDTGMRNDVGGVITLKELMKEVYHKACQQKLWGLVRHTAGTLGKRVEDLAKAVTDLLVRQKQVTVGMPPLKEHAITAPLPENELRLLIHQAYGDDESTAMLTQELLLYLAMFIRTEPQLFCEMLRLRVGLLIQVMAGELCRTLNCSGEEASEHLLNLSPYEMKNLLYHIMSGMEFQINSVGVRNFSVVSLKSTKLSKKSDMVAALAEQDEKADERARGQWLRRRRLDGALNRVPIDLYPRLWHVLEKCEGIIIEGHLLHHNLTKEMTSGELKFALAVESGLNSIPQPEYRQLLVETLTVLSLITEYKAATSLGGIIAVENLVHKANEIFLLDQVEAHGDALLCCAGVAPCGDVCGGAAGLCLHFYDSAPSGPYGTMTYIVRAVLQLLDCFPQSGNVQCAVS